MSERDSTCSMSPKNNEPLRVSIDMNAARHLAIGSAETAADLERLYRLTDERVADEFQHLGRNFARIVEIIESRAGDAGGV